MDKFATGLSGKNIGFFPEIGRFSEEKILDFFRPKGGPLTTALFVTNGVV